MISGGEMEVIARPSAATSCRNGPIDRSVGDGRATIRTFRPSTIGAVLLLAAVTCAWLPLRRSVPFPGRPVPAPPFPGRMVEPTVPVSADSDSLYSDSWPAMGTVFSVELIHDDRARAQMVFRLLRDEVERVEQMLSDYRPTSEFSRINRSSVSTLDPEVFSLFLRLDSLVIASRGAFDPSVGMLIDAWGFRSDRPRVPEDTVLTMALNRSGWRHVKLDNATRSVTRTLVRLDPGAFGKGYALDRLRSILVSQGVQSALIDAGGSSFLALAPPAGRDGWRVSIGERGSSSSLKPETAVLACEAMSVSGQSGRQFLDEGVSYGHILDPRTGRPALSGRVVAVRAKSAFVADAISTALYVLGANDAAAVIDTTNGMGALLLDERDDPVRIHWPTH